ncbi:sulfotransferase [Salinibacter grassmerensis]|uniref:sulfotransferase n=1 Tax=Salinibacter grassmerensis TaxID=3040353 RepID=UPI0021E9AC9B|nr:sulfotransferase [Salinibacter grassmerensis]
MRDKEISVVYILSSGRSGSTLTDLLLGSLPGFWTLGEASMLPYELRDERSPCGCGNPISQCDFWDEVVPRISLDEDRPYPIGYFRESYSRRITLRWREVTSILSGSITSVQARAAREYGAVNAKYFAAVRAQASVEGSSTVEWLIDASKDPYRLYWLLYSGRFNLRVVHLTKDPRAYVYSMARGHDSYSVRDVIRWAGRWAVDNFIQSALTKIHFGDASVLHRRYEDIATHPSEMLSDIKKWLDVPGQLSRDEKKGLIRGYKNHAVSGNKMRWEDTKIELDEKWKRNLSENEKNMVWFVAGWLATLYGYER